MHWAKSGTSWKSLAQTASQGLSSANNLLLTTAVLSVASVEGLGHFNLPFALYLAVLGIHRALIVDTVLALRRRDVYVAAQRVSICLSLMLCFIIASFGYLGQNYVLLLFGVLLPGLLLIDLRRNWAIVSGAPSAALFIDALWVMGTLLSLILPINGLVSVVAIWGASGIVALILSFFLRAPSTSQGNNRRVKFWKEAKGIATSSTAESVVFQIGWQLPVAFTLELLSATAAGEYRLVVTLFGPLAVIVTSWTLGTYRLSDVVGHVDRFISKRSIGIGIISLSYWFCCLVAFLIISNYLTDRSFQISVFTLAIVGLQVPITATTSQFAVWLKKHRLAVVLLVSRLYSSIIVFGACALAVWQFASVYALSAMTLALAFHSVLVFILYRRELRNAV